MKRTRGAGETPAIERRHIPRELVTWVELSCAAQGIAVKVTDPLVVSQVAALFGQVLAPAQQRGGERLALESPNGLDAAGVELLDARCAGANGGMVEDRADDGRPPGQAEAGPLVA